MDDFIENVFLSPTWQDINRAPWPANAAAQTSGALAAQIRLYEGTNKNMPTSMISSSHAIGPTGVLPDDDNSILVDQNSSYDLQKELYQGETQLQESLVDLSVPAAGGTNGTHQSEFLLRGAVGDGTASLGLQLNVPTAVTLLPQSSPKLSASVGPGGSGSSDFQQSLINSHAISSWPPSYNGVSVLPSLAGQGKLSAFGWQGDAVEAETSILEPKLQQLDNLAAASEQDGAQDSCLPPFTGSTSITLTRPAVLHSQQQLSQVMETNPIKHFMDHPSISPSPSPPAGVSNGVAKPRVRARRGQATDPHSIAERLRREKIAERMKNLQELVPNSNKTDKASMLDEIIEYVKFLQLQVKVLSMSRLGAAGAVVPLITDVQSEGSSSFLLPASVGHGPDLTDSPDNIAFEQEVVKLMETNVTSAMQFLQTKGLCLMPIALAAAISGGTPSSDTPERKKPIFSLGVVSPNGSSITTSAGTHHPSSSESGTRSETTREEFLASGCDGAMKQEEVHKIACNVRELKP